MRDPRVCVIGAGAAGLTTIKQLKDVNITNVDCFEKEKDIGGIFNYGTEKNGVYDNCVLTISNYMMAFSDMPPTGHRYHWHHSEYKNYLLQYAKAFDLAKHVNCSTTVMSIEGGPGKWHVVVKGPDGQVVDKGFYDAVAVCSGTHQAVNHPTIPGQDSFTGVIKHSGTYKNNADFVGKDCVCVGIGESGADIVREISDVARSTVLSMRGHPFMLARLARLQSWENPTGASSDAFTTRLKHDYLHVSLSHAREWRQWVNRLAYTLGAFLFVLFPFMGRSSGHPPKDAFNQENNGKFIDKNTPLSKEAEEFIVYNNMRSGQGIEGQKFACKNVTFVDNVVKGKISTNYSGVKCLEGDFVVFNDGSRARCEQLVLCTGYKDKFDFLKGSIGDSGEPLSVPGGNVRQLYKHVFHPQIGESMAWIGFVRPSTGGIPACAEMAARYWALLLKGDRKLPKNIATVTSKEYEKDTEMFKLSANVKTLVNFKEWMDTMAEHIGCNVQLWKYVFQPSLFVRLGVGSMQPSQYRLAGPGSNPALAKSAIMSAPIASTRFQILSNLTSCWLTCLGVPGPLVMGMSHMLKLPP